MKTFGKRETLAMKGIGVCLMLLHHLFYDAEHVKDCTFVLGERGKNALLTFSSAAKVCVAIFILLSGYGLYKSCSAYFEKRPYTVKGNALYLLTRLKKLLFQYWWAVIPFALLGLITGWRTFAEVYGADSGSIWRCITDVLGINYNLYGYTFMFNVTCWYIGLAVGLYVLFPFLYWLIKKDVTAFAVVCLILSFMPQSWVIYKFEVYIVRDTFWLLPFAAGIILARFDVLDKANAKIQKSNWYGVGSFLFLVATYGVRRLYPLKVDALLALAIILFALFVFEKIKYLGTVFAFMGKYSATVFMMHTFIYKYYFHDPVYSFKYPILIFLFLLAVCLLYAIALSYLQKGVNRLIRRK